MPRLKPLRTLLNLYLTILPIVVLGAGDYSLVVSGYDWGPGANKVILHLDQPRDQINPADFSVAVQRSTPIRKLQPAEAKGYREIVHAYISDGKGQPSDRSQFATLVLSVAPNAPLSSPMKYMVNPGSGNAWLDYSLTITHKPSGKLWTEEVKRIRPLVDDFNLDGVYAHEDETRLTYAWFEPQSGNLREGSVPVIIWLHGGGEGGTDPTLALMANRAANYASPEIQAIFQGAYVLVPQTPTRWMHATSGGVTWGQEDDIYHRPLIGLFREFLKSHPNADPSRIYVGGCSNGGYMSLKLLLENPDFFAAAFISAIAFRSEQLTDNQIQALSQLPIWFVHSADDRVTPPDVTVIPLYKRLKEAGADHVVLSYYDHVIDITGFFGGHGYRYNGHLSWIYHHANRCRLDYDGTPVLINGKPVTIMEWLASF